MELTRTVLVPHSAEEMFDLIEAAEHYPEFLPWCARSTIVERDDTIVVADIDVEVHGVRFGFRTRNPKRRPDWMAITMERGPFRRFHAEWRLVPLAVRGCRIDFDLRYDFDHTVLGKLAGPVFDRIANTLVDAYVARADGLHAVVPATAPSPVPSPPDADVAPATPESPNRSPSP